MLGFRQVNLVACLCEMRVIPATVYKTDFWVNEVKVSKYIPPLHILLSSVSEIRSG